MARSTNPSFTDQRISAVHALGRPGSLPPQTAWDITVTTGAGAAAGMTPPPLRPPEAPCAAVLTKGDNGDLTVTWTPPEANDSHGPATGFALRHGVGGVWTVVPGASSPCSLSGLPNGAVDVQVQAANAAGASAWSVASTLVTGANAPVLVGAAIPTSVGSLGNALTSTTDVRIATDRRRPLVHRKASAVARLLGWLARQLPLFRTGRKDSASDCGIQTVVSGESGLLARNPWVTRRTLTIADYRRMGKVGILTRLDRVELIEGQLVAAPARGSNHARAVEALSRCLAQTVGSRCVVAVQKPLQLGDLCESEPDLVVLKPCKRGSCRPIPGAYGVLLVIEVSDNGAAYERLVKRSLYSRHGIPEFWIVDLAAKQVEVCRVPTGDDYAHVHRVDCEGVLAPELLAGVTFPTAMIFGLQPANSSR